MVDKYYWYESYIDDMMLEQKQSIVFLLVAPILLEVQLRFRLRLLLFPQPPLKSGDLLTKKQSVIIGVFMGPVHGRPV